MLVLIFRCLAFRTYKHFPCTVGAIKTSTPRIVPGHPRTMYPVCPGSEGTLYPVCPGTMYPHCPPGDQSEASKSMTANHSPPWGAVRVHCTRGALVQCTLTARADRVHCTRAPRVHCPGHPGTMRGVLVLIAPTDMVFYVVGMCRG